MGLLADCQSLFGTAELYEVLGVKKGCGCQTKLKKAYYAQSMKWHPDRFSGEEDNENGKEKKQGATQRFQTLTQVYSILKDKQKKAIYDETGSVDDEDVLGSEEDLFAFWRKMFKKVTEEDIKQFYANYSGSDEERADVVKAYNNAQGDMSLILAFCISDGGEERIVQLIREAIDAGDIKETPKFKKSMSSKKAASRKRKADQEAAEAEEMLKEMKKKEGDGDLHALIKRRQSERSNDLIEALEAKYAKPKSAKKGKK